MEFLTTEQRAARNRRLYARYALLSILVILATYVVVSTALGYSLLERDGKVVQNGLLFVNSSPDGAQVTLNNKLEENKTNARYSVPEGTYEVKIQKQGYREWNGSVALIGGTVKFLTYSRLMPTVPKELAATSLAPGSTFFATKDNRWLARVQGASIQITDQRKPLETPRVVSLSANQLTGKPVQSIQHLEWAEDNDHMLVLVQYESASLPTPLIIRREKPEEIVDISQGYTVLAGDTYGFWGGDAGKPYVKQSSGTVFALDTKSKTATQIVIHDPVQDILTLTDGRAMYTTTLNSEVAIKYFDGSKSFTMNTAIKDGSGVVMKSFRFNRNEFFLIGGAALGKSYIYRNYAAAVKQTLSTEKVAPYVTLPLSSSVSISASTEGRFVLASDGSAAVVYDVENRELIRYDIPVPRPASLGWIDNSRLYALGTDQRLMVMDFNGKNVYELGTSVKGSVFVSDQSQVAHFVTDSSGVQTLHSVDISNPTK